MTSTATYQCSCWRQRQCSIATWLSKVSTITSFLIIAHYSSIAAMGRLPSLGFMSLQKRSSIYNNHKSSPSDDSNSNYEDDINRNSDGMFLDEETYLQAEDNLLQTDGSLSLQQGVKEENDKAAYQTAVQGLFTPPSYSYSSDNNEEDGNISNIQQQLSEEEQLYQKTMSIKKSGDTNEQQMVDSETLHNQVFAEEQTYLQQSSEFRNSLSSLYDATVESPMATERREVIDQYNEQVLEDLLKDIDEMEKVALSRDEAMELAKTKEKKRIRGKDIILCSKCGCHVTPDMIERAEMIEIAKGGSAQRKTGDVVVAEILCPACHGEQFRTNDESKVRVATGMYNGSSYNSASGMFHKKREGAERYRGRRKWRSGSIDTHAAKERRSDVQGIDTSTLFKMPKKKRYTGTERVTLPSGPPTSPEKATKSSIKASIPTSVTRQPTAQRRQTRPPPRRRSSPITLGGGEELAKRRMRQQDLESTSSQNGNLEEQTAYQQEEGTDAVGLPEGTEETVVESEDASDTGDQWVKVEDPSSKRMLYWNTGTGEMKKTLE